MITFTVQGQPLPKQSFRVNKSGAIVSGYRDKRITVWQDKVGWAARIAMRGRKPIQDDVWVIIKFTRGDKRVVDIDNLDKPVLDAMNGIVYVDDKQVKRLHLDLEYGKKGSIEVEVRKLAR